MKSTSIRLHCGALLLGLAYQSSALAMPSTIPVDTTLTSYTAQGHFFGTAIEAISFDDETGDETFLNAFVDSQPFDVSMSTFTLRFSVDESVDGNIPLFSPSAFFSGAVSDVSLEINGSTVFDNAADVATPGQFPGDFGGTLAASWNWSFFPDPADLLLSNLSVTDADTFEPLGSIVPQGFFFSLFDSSRTLYDGGSILDLITLDLNDFDSTSFQLFWGTDFSEEPDFEFGEPPEINYTVFGSIDSLTTTAVPVPAALWLFGSAIFGLFGVRRLTP